jgi:hypothetical protein
MGQFRTIFWILSCEKAHRLDDTKLAQLKLSTLLKKATCQFKSAKNDQLRAVASKETILIK